MKEIKLFIGIKITVGIIKNPVIPPNVKKNKQFKK